VVISSDIKMQKTQFIQKLNLKVKISNRLKLYLGEYFATDFEENFNDETIDDVIWFKNNITFICWKQMYFYIKKLSFKTGLRGEYSELFKDFLAPRLSLTQNIR
jgi:hypothetical protein